MKRSVALSLVLLLSLPGCGSFKKETCKVESTIEMVPVGEKYMADEQVSMDQSMQSFFDQDSGEFIAQSDDYESTVDELDGHNKDDYAWADTEDAVKFKTIQFGFNEHKISADQADILAQDIERAKQVFEEICDQGGQPMLIIDGYGCLAGKAPYNVALSEKRAKAVRDYFVKAGIPAENIQVTGRGQESPIVACGDREEQSLNRRVELRLVDLTA